MRGSQKLGNYKAVQEKNLVTLEGKEYIMQDGDCAYFRFSVSGCHPERSEGSIGILRFFRSLRMTNEYE